MKDRSDKKPIIKKRTQYARNPVGNKAKPPLQNGRKIDREAILALIKKYDGNVSRVADALGTTRNTIHDRCMADSELGIALKNARERLIDDVEQSVLSRAREGKDTALQAFVLKTQGRHRGWDQDEGAKLARDIASEAFAFITNQTKNPAEGHKPVK